MDKFVVEGMSPSFDGEYPIDTGTFTMRELQIIKRMAGVRSGELEEAFSAGDTDLMLALAVIAVRRNGKTWEAFEQIAWESEIGKIQFVAEEEEVAEEAPPLTPPTSPDESETSGDETEPSTPDSNGVGDVSPEMSLLRTGGRR